MSKDLYVWYSPATDVTGKRIMENLGASGGTKKPSASKKAVLCWGTKTSENITMTNSRVLNHPNGIRTNRNKLLSLKKFEDGECNIAAFTDDFSKAGTKAFPYPLVARTKYHQGGAGFWLCLTKSQIAQAVKEGAQYMQCFIDIKDEFRLHVVGGKVVYAVKKVERTNHKDAFKKHYSEHVENYAKKNGLTIDKDTENIIMDRMARKFATGTDMVVRSNTRGWKFSRITKINKDLENEAIKAVKSLNLDFGAVDCCIGVDGKPYIIECNTGPGLEGSSLDAWLGELKKLVAGKTNPSTKKSTKSTGKVASKNTRERLKGKASFMHDMIDAADDTEVEALSGLWEKMGISN